MNASHWSQYVPFAVVFAGGAALAFQTPINGALGTLTGNGVFAAAVSFLGGFLVLAAIVAFATGLPDGALLRAAPWWMWTGGALGAFYVWAALTNVQKTGALSLFAALIAGQLFAALVIDWLGVAGIAAREVSWQRVTALALVFGGLLLSRM